MWALGVIVTPNCPFRSNFGVPEDNRAHPREHPTYAVGVTESTSSLGDFIRRQREMSAMSMREFAKLAGISNPYLSQIERGLRAPSEQVIQAIASTLQVSADTLYEQAGVSREPEGESQVLAAIRADTRLTGRQRQALTQVYEAFVATAAQPHRARHAAGDTAAAAEPDGD
jgi:transcriptional regulator with XRE-family HTH domain